MTEDSIEGIYETLARCAKISKAAGGIGVNMSNIRAAGTYIAGTNGASNGLTPLLRVYNATARYVDQGGGKRKGAFAMYVWVRVFCVRCSFIRQRSYVEPWHADIFEVLDLKKNTGPDELRARDLVRVSVFAFSCTVSHDHKFYALWVPDLFMKRVESGAEWSLMCPHECPGLEMCHSEEFEQVRPCGAAVVHSQQPPAQLYLKYESQGKARRKVPAQQLWFAIVESQIETGTPYMLYKDSCNSKSNQKNLGTIRVRPAAAFPRPSSVLTNTCRVRICALKSSSTRRRMRWPCATWRRWR